PPPEQQHRWSDAWAPCETRGVYGPELRCAMTDREHQRTSERRDKVAEVPAAELSLATHTQTEHTAVLGQNIYLQHVPHHSNAVGLGNLCCNGPQPGVEVRARDATQLQRERHDLLRVDVRRSRWWRNGVDLAFAPERGDRQRCEQLFVISGEEEAVPLRAGAAAGPPHPLQQGRGAQGRTNLHHAIEVTDIYAELQGAGGDDDAIRLGGKGSLGCTALVQRE